MRKFFILLITIALLVLVAPADARKKKKKKVKKVEVVQVERNQVTYLAAKKKARAMEATEQFVSAVGFYQEAANLTPYGWVEAHRLNDVARMLLKLKDDEANGNTVEEYTRQALDILKKALTLVDVNRAEDKPSAQSNIESHILYCERVLGLKSWN